MNPIESMSPEQLQDLMKLAGLDDQNDLLKQQLAQATALRQPRKSYGLWGGLTNGLADAADKVFAGLDAHSAQKGLDTNMSEQSRLRGLAAGVLRNPAPQPVQWDPSANQSRLTGDY